MLCCVGFLGSLPKESWLGWKEGPFLLPVPLAASLVAGMMVRAILGHGVISWMYVSTEVVRTEKWKKESGLVMVPCSHCFPDILMF